MLKSEKNYEFRKRMLEVHKSNVRDKSVISNEDDFVIKNGFTVLIPEDADDVIFTSAEDFTHYLFKSMGISAMLAKGICDNVNSITLEYAARAKADLGNAEGARGYRIDIEKENIKVYGYDSRGIAQALYYLEFLMNIRRAPYLKCTTIMRKPLFTPQMVHSGYGLDQYPNEHLSAIAHEGRDSILIFVKDVDKTPYGYLDFNELIYRASKYGIDVYAYSYLKSEMHPEDKGAYEHYDNSYGKLFRECPGLKGVVLVGESVEFPSHDERVSPRHWYNNSIDGIPTGKPSPGWFPCRDYPQWVEFVKNIIRQYQPNADIVFWTYNWTAVDPQLSVDMLSNLPNDITVLSTFEKGTINKNKDGVIQFWTDYTLANAGPTDMFRRESEAVKKKGMRLYTMSNTGGLTWDMGVVPFQPAPYTWIKRYKRMFEAIDFGGLCGLMESHHYGLYPSIISKLSNLMFGDPGLDAEDALSMVIAHEYGAKYIDEIKKAFLYWSDATEYMTHSRADSYGPCRVGVGCPLCLLKEMKQPTKEYAHFGNRILHSKYNPDNSLEATLGGERIPAEILSWEKGKLCMEEGIAILENIPEPNEELLRLINMGRYIACGMLTGVNVKKFYLCKCKLDIADKDEAKKIISEMDALIELETENVKKAIPYADVDSRLGWEPSMEYIADVKALEWKLRELKYIKETELAKYKRLVER